MKPPVEDKDAGYFQPGDTLSLHRPPPAFSSPSSPEIRESDHPHLLSRQKSPISKFENVSRASSKVSSHRLPRSQSRSASPASTLVADAGAETNGSRDIIIRSFAPYVAVYASSDTDELLSAKGIDRSLSAFLRPFGERVQGKVVIRDSHGIGRAWDDFGIRICGPEHLENIYNSSGKGSDADVYNARSYSRSDSKTLGDDLSAVLNRLLDNDAHPSGTLHNGLSSESPKHEGPGRPSALFPEYLRVLLSSSPLVPYETFGHPIACLIAVSSRNEAPIETLRQLYAMTGRNNSKIPPWVGTEYLRYYVLVHDEDNDDIARSTALFDLMKRHFGLHCHLLRLRSLHCVATDDDSVQMRQCEWLSASEQQAVLRRDDYAEGVEDVGGYIFEQDANAIDAMIREMVTQSIVPFMESRVMTWNDQVVSRRRGLGGRFMSFSKRWAGFGSSKASDNSDRSGSNPGSSNFNMQMGFYPPETPEAIMRSLADYALMLRDWKLAYGTYEFMRSDFNHDKAWNYHAAASEMAALSCLLSASPQTRTRPENIDASLDDAVYSYLTRCSSPGKAKRCLVLATELLLDRGQSFADRAPGWACRMLETSVLGLAEQSLVTERIADNYMSKAITAVENQPSWWRHAAMWNVIGSLSWAHLGRVAQAANRFRTAEGLYSNRSRPTISLPFRSMESLWIDLSAKVGASAPLTEYAGIDAPWINDGSSNTGIAEDIEQLGAFVINAGSASGGFRGNSFFKHSIPEADNLHGSDPQSAGSE